jgi:hypothetical protein
MNPLTHDAGENDAAAPPWRRRDAAVALLATLALAACVAVPVDPRTGLPVPWHPPQDRPAAAGSPVTPAAPPYAAPPFAAPLPPQPVVTTARLYPVNDIGARGGMLTATIVDQQDGRGRLTLGYQGELLQGEATRVIGTHPGFGRIYQEALGTPPGAMAGRRGIANAVSPRGVHAQCEYVLTAPTQGTGACVFSDGAKHQLHFG